MKNHKLKPLKVRLLNGTGKTKTELQRLSCAKKGGKQSVSKETMIFALKRAEIESGDLTRIFSNFGPMMPPKKLRAIQGKILFTIDGYDDNPAELYEIPVVREYFFMAHRVWGGWLFFAELETACLKMVACCLSKNLTAKKLAGNQKHQVFLRRGELLDFMEEGIAPAAFFHARTGGTKESGLKHLHSVARYLGLK